MLESTSSTPAGDRDLAGRTLGDYVLKQKIGAGAYGTVYRCRQRLLRREVVVKVLGRLLTNEAQQRFLREAELASRLRHLYAAVVYQAGIDLADGVAWIAMELIEGITLDQWLRVHGPMPPIQAASFFHKLAQVIDAAHKLGIIHRDLTPLNVMVVLESDEPEPRLVDFGIALAQESVTEPWMWPDGTLGEGVSTEPEVADALIVVPKPIPNRLTLAGTRMGSDGYMSPEQWSNARTVGPATDIYSLGVVMFEALSGRVPFVASTTKDRRRLHNDAEIPPLGGDFGHDVDLVLKRAMAKSPDERYATASELAADLRRALRSEREELRAAAQYWADRGDASGLLWGGDMIDVLRHWARRSYALTLLERSFVTASLRAVRRRLATRRVLGVMAIALVCGVSLYMKAQRVEAVLTEGERQEGRSDLIHGDPDAAAHLARAYQRGDRSPSTEFMLARAMEPKLAVQARLASSRGRMWAVAVSPNGRQFVTTDEAGAHIWDAESYKLLRTLPHAAAVVRAELTADGSQIITAGGDSVRIWNANDGALVRALERPMDPTGSPPSIGSYDAVTIAPEGRLVAATDMDDTVIDVWDANTGNALRSLRTEGEGHHLLTFSADGRWLISAERNDVRVCDTKTWRERTLPIARARSLAFDPTGPRIIVGTAGGDVSVWDVSSGSRGWYLRDIADSIDAVAFSRDGQLVAAAGKNGKDGKVGTELVWRASGERLSRFTLRSAVIFATEFDQTGKLILTANADGTVVVTDTQTGLPVTVLEGPETDVRRAHFLPGPRVVGMARYAAWVWDASSPYRQWASEAVDPDCGIVTVPTPDDRFLAIGCRSHPTRIWDSSTDQLLGTLPSVSLVGGNFISAFPAVSSTGDRAAIAQGNGVEVYELPSARLLYRIEHTAPVNAVAFGPSGHDIVAGSIDGAITVSRDGTSRTLPSATGGIDAVAMLDDGRVLAADAGRRLRIYQRDGQLAASLELPGRVMALRSSGNRLVTVPIIPWYDARQTSPVLIDLDRYVSTAVLAGHRGRVFSARWAPSDEIVTAGEDGTTRRWDGRTGALLQIYKAGAQSVSISDATVSDENIVIGGGADGALRFWDAPSGQLLWTLQAHEARLVGLHLEPNGIVTRGFDGQVQRWRIPNTEQVLAACRQNARCAIVP